MSEEIKQEETLQPEPVKCARCGLPFQTNEFKAVVVGVGPLHRDCYITGCAEE